MPDPRDMAPSELVDTINAHIQSYRTSPTTPPPEILGTLLWELIHNQGPDEAFKLLLAGWIYDEVNGGH